MNVLFLADNFPPEKNAQSSRVYERACYWVNWGHNVTVITCAPNFPEGKVYPGYSNHWYSVETVSGIRVVRVKTFVAANEGKWLRIADFLSYMFTAFAAGLLQPRPDVIAATSPQFFAAVAGWALSVARRLPFVFELSDLWPASIVAVGAMRPGLFLRGMEKLELFLYRQSAAIVALTAAFKSDLVRRGIAPEKIAVVINGVDLARYAPQPRDIALSQDCGLSPNDFVVGYIGTHGMAHALENVLDAAERTTDPRIKYLFVGAGAARDALVKEKDRRNLRNVIMIPAQAKELMPAYWSLCDVALVHLKDTPVFETVIPSKIFEAMGMGIPVLLASPRGEASRILLEAKAGLWIPAEDPRELAAAVTSLCGNRELYERLGSNSHAFAPKFSRERQARDMLRTLAEAAGVELADAALCTPEARDIVSTGT